MRIVLMNVMNESVTNRDTHELGLVFEILCNRYPDVLLLHP
jgi:hypothetical protein